jgi:hypothetical protein
MKAQYNARTGEMIAVWTLRELKKKNGRRRRRRRSRKMWVHPIICDWLFRTTFEDLRRREVFNYFRMSVNSFQNSIDK